ncbi:hypothetical protein, partial [Sinorhizobium medicae]|uniref:hypothetical protein n=1 Tax=Sinorhizobium medicae TaxID=110321 RepID=UPI001AEC8A7D
LQRADTDDGGSIIEAEIHLAKRPKLFRQTEPALSHHRLFPGHCPGLRDAPEIVPLVPSDPIVEGPASADSGEKREPVRTNL